MIYNSLGLGRLGNHLFQIASTLGIAEKTGHKASFPEWSYEKYFKSPLPHLTHEKGIQVREKMYAYDASLLTLPTQNTYNLIGYFQSPKYWDEQKIRNQFEFTQDIIDGVKHKLPSNPVAVSVRRGDFVNNPNYFQLPVTYYLNAYYKHFPDCTPIIFSDDLTWCKKHFKAITGAVFAANLTDIEQLCLMSLCDKHIISNSTFSWWGAYLSGSTQVIRPEQNMAGMLAKVNSEKDYWPEGWQIFNDYKIDLTDTTFIIPVYYDHEDRRQNLTLTLAFLNTYFDTNIMIGEQGAHEFEYLDGYADYVHFTYDRFHRTRMINDMAKMANTPIVVNWDCDNLCSVAQISEAVNAVRNGADISYPFDGTVYRVPRHQFSKVIESLDICDLDEKLCAEKKSSVGHAVVMNKKSFIRSGMENEHFISWGPEDAERWHRYHILGLSIQRIPGAIWHLDHWIGENSSTKNEYFHANDREFLKVSTKKKPQLEEYINTWNWVK